MTAVATRRRDAAPADSSARPQPHRWHRLAVAAGLLAFVAAAGLLRLTFGSTRIPLDSVWAFASGRPLSPMDAVVLLDLRVPRALTASLAGAAMGVAGLQMQTLFGNPLAEPYVLGVSSGATLGVASVLLLGAGSFVGTASTTLAASAGAAAVMGIVLLIGTFVRSTLTLLLMGVMFGSMIGAAVLVMLSTARPELVADFIAWQFGSFAGTTRNQLAVLAPVLVVALIVSLLLGPWLNVLQVGERYAATMGVHVTGVRLTMVALCAVLAGATTAFCGPIQFLGMAVPHLARQLLRTADQRLLLPATALLGAGLAMVIDLTTTLPGGRALPLNAANAAIGAPIVIWILLRNARRTA